ncbi:CLUMA_CG001445, isoform A [Clunio marinus]|uniref:CLUMA_CG001445, isoform A n=1 Tax=Clunio marinus TaxID=568069 RepID=A0A1J1HN40_9DIPT|nr:CLUMA_CG001445, isoform A [Clunio marinus]
MSKKVESFWIIKAHWTPDSSLDNNERIFTLIKAWKVGENEIEKYDKTLMKATKSYLKSYYEQNELDIAAEFSDENLCQMLHMSNAGYKVKLQCFAHASVGKMSFESGVIIAQRLSSALEFLRKLFAAQKVKVKNKYLVVLLNETDNNAEEIFKLFWSRKFMNVKVLTVVDDMTILLTFNPWKSRFYCNNTTPIIIATFKNESWHDANVPSLNFHQCPIKVATSSYAPAVIFDESKEGLERFSGVDVRLVKELSKILNFTLEIDLRTNFFGYIQDNGSASGAIAEVVNGNSDLVIGFYILNELKTRFLSFTQPHLYLPVGVIIPPGELFTSLEKFQQPFTTIVWFSITGVLGLGFIIIFILHFPVQKSKLSEAFIVIAGTMLGLSHKTLPQRNSTRIALMAFILFFMIIRTLYIGAWFKFLQVKQRHPEISTIDELIESDIEVLMYPTFEQMIRGWKLHKKANSLSFSSFYQKLMMMKEPLSNLAVVATIDEVYYHNKFSTDTPPHIFLKEYLFTAPIAMYFTKESYIVEIFDDKINLIKTAGLLDFWSSYLMDSDYLYVDLDKDHEPEQMNFQQLSGAFEIWAFCCSFSFLVFLCEHFHYRLANYLCHCQR